ncbi:MAG TPA: acyltransferase [Clostridiales bacterium]|nr:acyltransferase [Clostridiales bacterium]
MGTQVSDSLVKARGQRQANLELIRIISMVMIICLHAFLHGGLSDAIPEFSMKYYFSEVVLSVAQIAVNCYVLISGYFLINSKFRIKKLLILLAEVFFYSVLAYVVFSIKGDTVMDIKTLTNVFLPTLMREYWFITTYVGLYAISPFLNIGIKAMSKAQHLGCVVVMFLLLSAWSNIMFTSKTLNTGGGYGFTWFIYLYIVAAYIRLHYKPNYHIKKPLIIYLVLALLTPVWDVAMGLWSKTPSANFLSDDFFANGHNAMYHYDSCLVFLSSVAFFVLFINIKIQNRIINKIIMFFAPCTLGVYLIHDNPYVRGWLWKTLNLPAYLWEWYFIPLLFVEILGVFVVCSVIDFVRQKMFSPINKSRWLDTLCCKLERLPDKIKAKVLK